MHCIFNVILVISRALRGTVGSWSEEAPPNLPRGEAPSDFTKIKQCLMEVKSRHKSATKIKNEKSKCPVDVIVWS